MYVAQKLNNKVNHCWILRKMIWAFVSSGAFIMYMYQWNLHDILPHYENTCQLYATHWKVEKFQMIDNFYCRVPSMVGHIQTVLWWDWGWHQKEFSRMRSFMNSSQKMSGEKNPEMCPLGRGSNFYKIHRIWITRSPESLISFMWWKGKYVTACWWLIPL